jgi:hypothetical protein
MDYPLSTPYPEIARRPRTTVSPFIPAAIVVVVLAAATAAACMVPDNRDVTARHGSVLRSQAL